MVKVLDPHSGEYVEIVNELVFDEAGSRRYEIQSQGGDILYLETKFGIKPSKKMYHDYEWLYSEYVTKGRTMSDISNQFGITPMSIQQWLNKLDIPTRSRGRKK